MRVPLLFRVVLGCAAAACAPASQPADAGVDAGAPIFTRAEAGEPVPAEEISRVTDLYLELLSKRSYFDFVDDRVHGWPQSDPHGRYWYGTWWSGVRVLKQGGAVTYVHSRDGADNNGIRTSPLLESACFALRLWKRPEQLALVRKLVRGFNSWILAMESTATPATADLMTRALYPEPVLSTDRDRRIFFDYAPSRPGEDNGATEYVLNAHNPIWPDLWVKNKRSKDDLGHMMRAVAQAQRCVESSDDAGLAQDVAQMTELYRRWARRVEQDGWSLATVDSQWGGYIPTDGLAHIELYQNAECDLALALRLYAHGDPGELDCRNGISALDALADIKPSNAQMVRSFHEAAIIHAQLAGQDEIARLLLSGLGKRVSSTLDKLLSPQPPAAPIPEDMGQLIVESAAVGLPLTWREVRYLHARIEDAHRSYLTGGDEAYAVFSPATPDGEYAFEPRGSGLFFPLLGSVLGDCASPYRNPTSKPVLDCEKVQRAGR